MDFNSGYVLRAIDQLPQAGLEAHRGGLYQNYALDILSLKRGSIEDGSLRFDRQPSRDAVEALAAR